MSEKAKHRPERPKSHQKGQKETNGPFVVIFFFSDKRVGVARICFVFSKKTSECRHIFFIVIFFSLFCHLNVNSFHYYYYYYYFYFHVWRKGLQRGAIQ